MNEKQVEDGIETIKHALEESGHDIKGVYALLVEYLEANVDDILDVEDEVDEWDTEEELF